jgi:hypothetical protein
VSKRLIDFIYPNPIPHHPKKPNPKHTHTKPYKYQINLAPMFFMMFPMFFKVKAIVQPWNLPHKGKSQQNQQITLVTMID